MLITYVRDALRGRAGAVVDFFSLSDSEQDDAMDAWSLAQTEAYDAEAAVKAAERAALQSFLDSRRP
jgi:hypothetical protein